MKKNKSAEAIITKVERPVVTEVTVVNLTMDLSDAEVLYRVLHSVGGDPAGPRGATDRICGALSRAGVRGPREAGSVKSTGSIMLSGISE